MLGPCKRGRGELSYSLLEISYPVNPQGAPQFAVALRPSVGDTVPERLAEAEVVALREPLHEGVAACVSVADTLEVWVGLPEGLNVSPCERARGLASHRLEGRLTTQRSRACQAVQRKGERCEPHRRKKSSQVREPQKSITPNVAEGAELGSSVWHTGPQT